VISTQALARACALHPWRTVGAWLVALVASIAAIALLLGSGITTDAEVTANTESKRGEAAIAEHFPRPQVVDEVVVVRSDELTVNEPAFRAFVERMLADEDARAAVAEATSHYETPDASLVSSDRHALQIPLRMGEDPEGGIEDVIGAVERADEDPRFAVTITGEFTLDRDFTELSEKDLQEGELFFGLPAALIVLVLVFGAVVAGLVPVLLAILSILVALALTALVGQVSELSFFVVNMISGMGLALGIDYSLFVVSRFREERRHGLDKIEAIATAGATSSRAVLFSGVAFVVSMIGMVFVPDTILRSLAAGAILVGIASVAAALTLLPAVLGLLGDRVNALRIPWFGREAEADSRHEGRFWGRAVRGVMRRPTAWLAAVAVLLLIAAAPVVTLQTGTSGVSTLPADLASRQGFEALERSFGTGSNEPVLAVAVGPGATDVGTALVQEVRRLPGFGEPQVERSGDGQAALLTAPVAGDPNSEAAADAVRALRNSDAANPPAGDVFVTGESAEQVDYSELIAFWLPLVIGFVLLCTLLLLTAVFRSLVVALTAIGLNLLSVGAAYGLLVLVFQHGVAAGLFGFTQVDAVEAWVPLFLFSVLFGLSMDYHVFIVSRIREAHLATGSTDEAVAHGVASTARLITGAALIIIVVFVGFATGDLVMFQQMGFGVAVALLIDATLVRTVLLPAAMTLLGERNWWLPSWLGWLPEVQVEGPAASEEPAS
jgi:RND superfamily putative drug exporter